MTASANNPKIHQKWIKNAPAHSPNTPAPPPAAEQPTQLYTYVQLAAMTGLTRSQFRYHRRTGTLPPPIGGRAHARYDWRHVHIASEIVKRRRMPTLAAVAAEVSDVL